MPEKTSESADSKNLTTRMEMTTKPVIRLDHQYWTYNYKDGHYCLTSFKIVGYSSVHDCYIADNGSMYYSGVLYATESSALGALSTVISKHIYYSMRRLEQDKNELKNLRKDLKQVNKKLEASRKDAE